MIDSRRRVAVISYTCQPDRGSEPEVGWRWSRQIPPSYEATVYTRAESFHGIPGDTTTFEGKPAKEHSNVTYVCIDVPVLPQLTGPHRLVRFHSLVWQLAVLRHLRTHSSKYDLAHHLTFTAVWMPAMAAFTELPMVWGPMGTSVSLPEWAREGASLGDRLRHRIRHLVTQRSPRWNPLVQACQRRATHRLVVHERFRPLVSGAKDHPPVVYPAIGIPREQFPDDPPSKDERDRSLLFVGRDIESKLPGLAFSVAEDVLANDPTTRADFVGPGLPSRFSAPTHPHRLSVEGRVPHAEVLSAMDQAQVFLFPSFEGSGFVVLEAMARGLPVVCLEGTGPSGLVDDAGVTVEPASTRVETAHRLRDAVMTLLDDRRTWEEVSRAQRDRVQAFYWDRLPSFLEGLYDATLQGDPPPRPAVFQRSRRGTERKFDDSQPTPR